MSEPVLQAVSQPEARRAVARSRAYATFARLFDYPDGELFEDVRDGTLAEALRSVLAEVDPACARRAASRTTWPWSTPGSSTWAPRVRRAPSTGASTAVRA
jgi:hypothetical protein